MMLQGVAVLRLQRSSQWVAALQEAVLQQLGSLAPRDISQVGAVLSRWVPLLQLGCVVGKLLVSCPHNT